MVSLDTALRASEPRVSPSAPVPTNKIVKVTLEEVKAQPKMNNKWARPHRITLLFSGDTHSHLEEYKSYIAEEPLGGIVRRINYFKKVQELMPHPVLILDAGDFLHGTSYYSEFKGEADIEFMNMAGYHVITIGNHDFEDGWDHLEKLLKKGHFEALNANIFREDNGKHILPPYTILKIGELNVAVVGIMGISAWESIRLSLRAGLTIVEPSKTLEGLLPVLKENADCIILLSHAGIEDDCKLAQHPLVDMVIGGHSHTNMEQHKTIEAKAESGTMKKTPVFHSFSHGRFIGRMDFIVREKRTLGDVQSTLVRLDKSYNGSHASEIRLQGYKSKLGISRNEPIGFCHQPVSSANKMQSLIPLGVQIAEIFRLIADANLGCFYSGSIKSGIERGLVTMETLHQMLPHNDILFVATIKGSLLIELLREFNIRWGKDKTVQYAGIEPSKIDLNSHYKVAAPSFFFEREKICDHSRSILSDNKETVTAFEECTSDLMAAFIHFVKTHGLGPWITSLEDFKLSNK